MKFFQQLKQEYLEEMCSIDNETKWRNFFIVIFYLFIPFFLTSIIVSRFYAYTLHTQKYLKAYIKHPAFYHFLNFMKKDKIKKAEIYLKHLSREEISDLWLHMYHDHEAFFSCLKSADMIKIMEQYGFDINTEIRIVFRENVGTKKIENIYVKNFFISSSYDWEKLKYKFKRESLYKGKYLDTWFLLDTYRDNLEQLLIFKDFVSQGAFNYLVEERCFFNVCAPSKFQYVEAKNMENLIINLDLMIEAAIEKKDLNIFMKNCRVSYKKNV